MLCNLNYSNLLPLVPGGVRTPGDVGPEYPVVRSFSIGSRPSSGPVVHREPPQRMNTNTYRQSNAPDRQSKPAMRYTAAASRNKAASPPKETNKPSASNLYEDHLRNRRQQVSVDVLVLCCVRLPFSGIDRDSFLLPHRTVLQLHYTVPQHTTLHHNTPYYITPHYITPHYITLHHITLH